MPQQVGDKFVNISKVAVVMGSGEANIEHDGKVMLIDFWATWCPPCQKPMAHNQEMLVKNEGKWADVRIIGLSIDDDAASVKSHVESKGWTKPEHYQVGNSGVSDSWGISGVPHCALVNKAGEIVWRGHPASVDLEAEINKLL